MATLGWCPSARLFEAAACGATIVSDDWPGLAEFYGPGEEILLARESADVLAALELDVGTLQRIGRAARERTLDQHTSAHRAQQLIAFLEQGRAPGVERAATSLAQAPVFGFNPCGA